MLHVVQFSGGAASAYVAWLVAQKYGRDKTVLLFHDTKAEHPDAYRFRRQVSDYIGIPITEVSDGRSLWELIEDEKCLPSYFMPFCTRILKQEQGERYLRGLETKGIPYTIYNGLGFEEWKRVQRATARAEALGRKLVCPLFELKIPGAEVKRIIRDEWGICLPEPYKYLDHNNCIPCYKAGKKHWYQVWRHYREEFNKAKLLEEKLGHTVFKGTSLTELEKQWETAGQQLQLFDEEDNIPCMCAL